MTAKYERTAQAYAPTERNSRSWRILVRPSNTATASKNTRASAERTASKPRTLIAKAKAQTYAYAKRNKYPRLRWRASAYPQKKTTVDTETSERVTLVTNSQSISASLKSRYASCPKWIVENTNALERNILDATSFFGQRMANVAKAITESARVSQP